MASLDAQVGQVTIMLLYEGEERRMEPLLRKLDTATRRASMVGGKKRKRKKRKGKKKKNETSPGAHAQWHARIADRQAAWGPWVLS